MVQYIQFPEGKPSTGARLNEFMNRGFQELREYQKHKHTQELIQQENKAAERMGLDLKGIQDPKMREKAFELMGQARNQQQLEMLKQYGKEQREKQKQSFVSNLFKGQQDLPDEGQKDQKEPSKSQEKKGFDVSKLSDEEILISEAIGIKGLRSAKDASLKKTQDEKTEKRRTFESDRDFHTKGSDPIVKAAEGVVREAPIKKTLIAQQRRDIASGNTSGIIPFMVDKLGLEAYRDPESARFKTASKERFVASVHELGSAGARANQYIEQQLVAAQAALGRSEEANQSVLDLEEFINDAKETRAQIELDLAEQDMKELGYARRDIANRADKLMKPYMEQRQDEMAYDIRKRHEENLDDESLTKEIVSGNIGRDTPLTLRAARILMIKNNDDEKKAQEEAKKLGFRFPSEKTYKRQ